MTLKRESLDANDALEVLVNQLEKEGYKIPESKEKLAELILGKCSTFADLTVTVLTSNVHVFSNRIIRSIHSLAAR